MLVRFTHMEHKLTIWRVNNLLRKRQVALALGVSPMAVGRYEKGRIPTPRIQAAIRDLTDGFVQPNDWYASHEAT